MWACLVAQTVKNSAAMQVTQVRSLGWEDPLEKGRVTPFSNLAWRIPWTEKPDGRWSISPWGCKELDSTERLTVSLSLLKMYNLDHLGGPVVKILPFQCGRGRGWRWVRSLVRDLRSPMPRGQKKNKKPKPKGQCSGLNYSHNSVYSSHYSRICSSSQEESLYSLNSLLLFWLFCLFCYEHFNCCYGYRYKSGKECDKGNTGKVLNNKLKMSFRSW